MKYGVVTVFSRSEILICFEYFTLITSVNSYRTQPSMAISRILSTDEIYPDHADRTVYDQN